MNFFTDQDVYAVTVRFLRNSGHDVITAYEAGLSRADDRDLLREAGKQKRIFVTRDRDFGSLVFVEKQGRGVVYLRILPSTVNAVHDQFAGIIRAAMIIVSATQAFFIPMSFKKGKKFRYFNTIIIFL
ncbi:MAG: hypothetical protein C4B58_10635 [Deltaproteobacteria bacterium]|nr:MAG: hypothetical protein C4B58_10635 [Deltaproteobacteria bacterium]